MMNEVCNELDIKMDCVAPKEHEATAECNNGTHQEWFCTALHPTPHECPPIVAINVLKRVTSQRLNMFSAKDRESCEFSPSAIIGAQKLDHKKHLPFMHGKFCQAHLNQTAQNNTVKCTLNSICLCPNLNPGCGHKVLNLNTSKVVT